MHGRVHEPRPAVRGEPIGYLSHLRTATHSASSRRNASAVKSWVRAARRARRWGASC